MFGSETFLFIHFVEPYVKIMYKTNILKYYYYLNINLKLVTLEITIFFVYFIWDTWFFCLQFMKFLRQSIDF
jgi:hypothetical protein